MHKFHSVFVSHDGRVFSCGHGQGGRLGLGSEVATLTPSAMRLQNSDGPSVSCTMVCVGRDHTVLLMENGTVSLVNCWRDFMMTVFCKMNRVGK